MDMGPLLACVSVPCSYLVFVEVDIGCLPLLLSTETVSLAEPDTSYYGLSTYPTYPWEFFVSFFRMIGL